MAGSADFKTELQNSDMFDQRLKAKVVKVVDVSYGWENGFNQAIDLAQDSLTNLKFVKEKKLLTAFFEDLKMDTGMACVGLDITLKALTDLQVLDKLIVFENLDVTRYLLRNPSTAEEKVLHLSAERAEEATMFKDFEIVEKTALLEWLAEHYQEYRKLKSLRLMRGSEPNDFRRRAIGDCV